MKIPAFGKLLRSLIILAAVCVFMPSLPFGVQAQAQGCSVTISIATPQTASGNCFAKAGSTVRASITGTWAGTTNVDFSRDGGSSWVNVASTTANVNNRFTAQQDGLFRAYFYSRISGTVTGTLTGETYSLGRFAYETVPMGSVAWASQGTSTASVAGTIYTADLVVLTPFLSTGCAVLNGAVVGTDNVLCVLYDSGGNVVANTLLAGTLSAVANTPQKIPWTSTVMLPAGQYHLGWQGNGTTATARMIAASTYVNVVTSSTAGAFGVLPAFTPPTGFTTVVGIIGYIY